MIKPPIAFQLGQCIGRITRRETEASLLSKPASTRLAYGGTFHSGDRATIAMCAADLSFAAFSGAALSMVPADVAEEEIKAGQLGEMLRENFAEVLNVLARAFVITADERMTLLSPVFPPETLPATLGAAAAASVQRADFAVEIDGYGSGFLTFWCVAR